MGKEVSVKKIKWFHHCKRQKLKKEKKDIVNCVTAVLHTYEKGHKIE